jgi:outer membrane protein assembly factor BamB
MIGRIAHVCLGVVAGLAFLVPSVRGEDWPQWLGVQRDANWREDGILEKFPEGGPKVRWRTPISAGYSGPAVADGKVFITDRVIAPGAKDPDQQMARGKNVPGVERIHCIDEKDGQILWTHEYDCPYTVSYPLGPRTTPAVKDGKVYALGAEGNLLCIDIASGKPVWSHDFKKEYQVNPPYWGHSAHLLIDGNTVISMVGGDGSAVMAFDKESGKEIWRSCSCKNIGYCPPVILDAGGKRQLVVWTGEAIHSLDPETGKQYWTEPAPTYQAMSISTPRHFGDDVFFTAYPAVAISMRLAKDAPTASVLWKNTKQREAMHSCFSTPYYEKGHLYGCSLMGELVCIKADTGERVWGTFQPLNNAKNLASAETFLVKNGDRFFLFTENGDLIIAKLTPEGYNEVSRAHLLDPTSKAWNRPVLWSHPAYANRSIYLRNDKVLICVSLAK